MRFIKPLDVQTILKHAKTHQLLVTLEENTLIGGAGSYVNQIVHQAGLFCQLLNLGLPDEFTTHDTPEALLSHYGLDAQGILHSINVFMKDIQKNDTKNLHYQND